MSTSTEYVWQAATETIAAEFGLDAAQIIAERNRAIANPDISYVPTDEHCIEMILTEHQGRAYKMAQDAMQAATHLKMDLDRETRAAEAAWAEADRLSELLDRL